MGNKQDMTAVKQSLKDKLMAIILLETSKDYKEMDSDLVTECVDFLMELEGKQRLTKKEIEQKVNAIPFKGKVTAIGSYAKKKVRAKRIAVIAAILAVLIALFGLLAVADGDKSLRILNDFKTAINEMLSGETVEYENITVIKSNESKSYSSLEEFAQAENYVMLYPVWLPENEKIVSVWYINNESVESYLLQCNNPYHSISVEKRKSISEEMKAGSYEVKINSFNVYCHKLESTVQAFFEHNGCLYNIRSDTEDNLFGIINNLEEIN